MASLGHKVLIHWVLVVHIYQLHVTGSSADQIMVCRLIGTKPLLKRSLTNYGILGNKLNWNLIPGAKYFFTKMSSAKFRPFCTGHNISIMSYTRCLQHRIYFTGVKIHFLSRKWLSKPPKCRSHYDDVIMTTMASQITSIAVVYSTVYSDADQRKHQTPASLAFVWGNSPGPVNSPHKGPVTRKMFPFDDVIMMFQASV